MEGDLNGGFPIVVATLTMHFQDVTREVTEYSKSKQYFFSWFVQIVIITTVYI